MNLTGNEADYLEYVALLLAEQKLNFAIKTRIVSNASEMHDSALEHLGQVFDPDRSKVLDLSEPWDVFRAAHFEIQEGKRNLKWQTHANAEVHFQYYQWLQTLEGMSGEQVKAEFESIKAEEKEHSYRYYRREVDNLLRGYKDTFERQMRNAKDPQFLISEQVDWWTFVLMPDKAENVRPEWEREYNANLHFQKLRHESGNIRVGKRVPSVVRKPDLKRQHPQHEAEARQEYLDWLMKLPQNSKPDMIAGQAFAFTADGKLIEKPTLQTIVEYFNEQGAEVQLCANFSNEEVVLRVQLLKDNTDLEADAREADPSELQALFDAKFTKARDSNRFKTPQAFAKAEVKRLRKAWADDADRFPIAEQWFEHLERMASETATGDPAQPERANTPPQGNEDGTGAEIEPEPLEGTREAVVNILDPLQDAFITTKDFDEAVNRVCAYFDGELKQDVKPLRIKRNNWKALGKALGDIFEDIRTPDVIDRDYLQFAKDTFDCFAKHDISGGRLQGITLYKYMKHKNS